MAAEARRQRRIVRSIRPGAQGSSLSTQAERCSRTVRSRKSSLEEIGVDGCIDVHQRVYIYPATHVLSRRGS